MCTIAQAGRQWPSSCGGIGQICPLPASQPRLIPGLPKRRWAASRFCRPACRSDPFWKVSQKNPAQPAGHAGVVPAEDFKHGSRSVRLRDSLRPVIMISSCPAVILPAASLNRNPSPTGDSCFTRENPAARQHKGFVLPAGVRVPRRCHPVTCLPKAAAGTTAR